MKRSISQEANGELADLLQSLFATLTEYYTNGTNVTSYQSGDCFGNSHMPELCQHVLTANEYLKENAEEIELAEVKMQEDSHSNMKMRVRQEKRKAQ